MCTNICKLLREQAGRQTDRHQYRISLTIFVSLCRTPDPDKRLALVYSSYGWRICRIMPLSGTSHKLLRVEQEAGEMWRRYR